MARFKPFNQRNSHITDAVFEPVPWNERNSHITDAEFEVIDPPDVPTLEQQESQVQKILDQSAADDMENAFLGGEVRYVISSNVSWIQYLFVDPATKAEVNQLYVGFKDGSTYAYDGVTFEQALDLYRAASKGTWVWDNLRVRGTVFGYQIPYRLVSGQRMWYQAGQSSQARHQAIPKSGEPYKGYHPSMNFANAKGKLGAEGIRLGRKGSRKVEYFSPVKAAVQSQNLPPGSK